MATIRARKIKGIAYDVKCCIAGKDEQFTGETSNPNYIELFLSVTNGNPSSIFIPVGNDRYISVKTIESIFITKLLED